MGIVSRNDKRSNENRGSDIRSAKSQSRCCKSVLSVESSRSCSSQVFRQGLGIGRFRPSKKTKESHIFQMIEKEQWSEVWKIIKTSRGKKICMRTDTSGLSVLGLALGFHAPLDIIAELLKINPNSSTERDMFDAVPLHLACLNGVSSNIVKYLMNHDNNIATLIRDNDKRLPLHHAVEYAVEVKDTKDVEDVDLEVIKLLCSMTPAAVRMSDIHGDSPIDLAQMVKVQAVDVENPIYRRADKVYQVLKEANIRLYRLEKRRAEGFGRLGKTCATPITEDVTSAVSSLNISVPPDHIIVSESIESLTKQRTRTFLGNLFSRKSRCEGSQKKSSSDI